jgi:hypothetical protein
MSRFRRRNEDLKLLHVTIKVAANFDVPISGTHPDLVTTLKMDSKSTIKAKRHKKRKSRTQGKVDTN